MKQCVIRVSDTSNNYEEYVVGWTNCFGITEFTNKNDSSDLARK